MWFITLKIPSPCDDDDESNRIRSEYLVNQQSAIACAVHMHSVSLTLSTANCNCNKSHNEIIDNSFNQYTNVSMWKGEINLKIQSFLHLTASLIRHCSDAFEYYGERVYNTISRLFDYSLVSHTTCKWK